MSENKIKKKCLVFTLFYPVTHQGVSYDSYVSSEIEMIAGNFDEVHVISMGQGYDGYSSVPSNVTFECNAADVRFIDKLLSIRFVFSKLFIDEVQKCKKDYKRSISLPVIKSILLFLVKASKYKVLLERQLEHEDFTKTKVVIYSYWTFENSLAAVLLKQKFPLKVFTRMHSLDLYFDRLPENYIPFRKLIYDNCDDVFFISRQGEKYFEQLHNIVKGKKGIINRIGISNNTAYLPSKTDKIVLLSNAWIQPLKRIDLIARALALVPDVPIDWIHVGDDYGTSRFDELKEIAKQLLEGKTNVTYSFVGRKTQVEIYSIYEQYGVNLFINVSTTEGVPVSMMEALSFGVPVIATRVGGVPEIIVDGYNGFLLDKDIVANDVASAIIKYAALPFAQKEQMIANAKQMWLQNYNAAQNNAELVDRLLLADD
jgi:glycosyltransferase involved in cell wall biosynthesis